jgi:hypothetical protein
VRIALVLFAFAACSKHASYPDTEAGFREQMEDAITAAKAGDDDRLALVTRDLTLPNARAWYASTFGADHADALVAELANEGGAQFGDDAPVGFKDLVAHDRTHVEVVRTDKPCDEATGFQNIAIRSMKRPIALYLARFTRPDGSGSFTLWSFAYVDGAFRMIGKTKALHATTGDKVLDELGELPVAEARQLLDERIQ